MQMKTAELTGAALDWAVAKCEGGYQIDATGLPWDADASNPDDEENGCVWFKPSTEWEQGGPIIEREIVSLDKEEADNRWAAYAWLPDRTLQKATGQTPLIAAMRCYVASKLGDAVEIPSELTE